MVQLHHDGSPSPSSAGLVVTALPGEANMIAIARASDGRLLVRDQGAALFPGEHCIGGGAEVACSGAAPETALHLSVSASDGNDRIAIEDPLAYRSSSLSGATGDDVVIGGQGDDAISGSSGDDQLDGAGGNDELRGDEGTDVLSGGRGIDTASWSTDSGAVSVTLDDRSDDGHRGEGDNVRTDVENLEGGDGPNRLVGSDGPNVLEGGESSNELLGGGGDDRLVAPFGQGGLLNGGPGRDRLEASPENAVHVRDGEVDRVECRDGLGGTPRADTIDRLEGCGPPVSVRGRGVARMTPDGRVSLRLRCGAIGQRCRARVRVSAGEMLLGRSTVELRPGRVRATIRLNRRGRNLVERLGSVGAEVWTQGFAGRWAAFAFTASVVLRRA